MSYSIKLSSGVDVANILPFESNGTNNLSTAQPTKLYTVDGVHHFVISGDFTARFVDGFEFNVDGDPTTAGAYTVNGQSMLEHDKTIIPVREKIERTNIEVVGHAPLTLTYSVPKPATSLLLLGQGSSTYGKRMSWGEAVQQNLVFMLENFAHDQPPVSPLVGQLWYDTSIKLMRVWDGEEWIGLGADSTDEAIVFPETFKCLQLSEPATHAQHAVNKQYVDSFVNGVIWRLPIYDPNLFDDQLSTPPEMERDDAYNFTFIVSSNGQGEWEGLDGHAVQHTGTGWRSVLERPVTVGDRFGVMLEPSDTVLIANKPRGSLSGRAGQIATVTSVSPLKFSFELPGEPDAVAVVPTRSGESYFAGRGFTFRGQYGKGSYATDYRWTEFVFSAPMMPRAVPMSSSSPGNIGDTIADGDYVYVYGTHGWRRIKAETF
jgi:hypothetical protein